MVGGGGYYGGGSGCRGGGGGGSSYFNSSDKLVDMHSNIVGGAVPGSGFVVISYYSVSTPNEVRSFTSTVFSNSSHAAKLFSVPTGVSSVILQAYGAQGGASNGGMGGLLVVQVRVNAGDVFVISVGENNPSDNCVSPTVGGGGSGNNAAGCGGGKTTVTSSTGILLIAGGGGGGAPSFQGGFGGGETAGNAVCDVQCAGGGSQLSGGTGGYCK